MPQIFVEVRPANVTGGIPRSHPAVPESFASLAGEVADTITEVVGELCDHLEAYMAADESHLWRVTAVELGFQLPLQAEAGVVVAQASTEATFSAALNCSKGDG